MSVLPGSTQNSSLVSETTGLVGTLTWRLVDSSNNIVTAAATSSITEGPTGTYVRSYTAPSTVGTYQPIWNDGADIPDTPIVVSVSAPAQPIDLTTVAAVREFLQKQGSDTNQDAVIASLITRASAAIQGYASREFVSTVSPGAARLFEYDWQSGSLLSLAPYDVQSVSQVRINADQASPTTLQTTEFRLFPSPNPLGVYTALRVAPYVVAWRTTWWQQQIVEVTGTWGFPSIPDDVVQACIVTVAIWLRRDVQAFSQTFNIDEQTVERPEALPSAVKGMLAPYDRTTYV